MNHLRGCGLLLYLSALLGCAAGSDDASSFEPEQGKSSNQCTDDLECKGGRCEGSTCVAIASTIEAIALEVIAPASMGAGEYQQMRYLQTVPLGTAGNRDILLERVAALSVAIRPPKDNCDGLSIDRDGLLPVRIEVLQNPQINGISSNSYVGGSGSSSVVNAVTIRVPPGPADIYIEPNVVGNSSGSDVASDCVLAPFLVRGQTFPAGAVSFAQALPVARRVSVDVTIPTDGTGASPLHGFILDMVEPLYGFRVSSRATLSEPSIADGKAHYSVTLAYQPVVATGDKAMSGRELFRLKPKDAATAPTYYVARVAADPFGTDHAVVDQITSLPPIVSVSGKVEAESGATATVAEITAVLRGSGDSSTGAVTDYRVTTTSDTNGRFQFSLVAGKYDVAVSPSSESKVAARLVEWTIAEEPKEQAGKLITLPSVATLTGKVIGPSDAAKEWSANVLAVPTTNAKSARFIDSLVEAGQLVNRRTSVGAVGADGTFELPVDSGAYDVFIRPSEGSGYPWAVRPSTVIAEGSLGLGPIRVSSPFVYSGAVTVPSETSGAAPVALPGALLRAFALFDVNGRLVGRFEDATRAVQIGESRATTKGQYELRLPASLE